jgi:hypothetical protein
LATFTFLISTTHNTQEEEEEEMKAEKNIRIRSFVRSRPAGLVVATALDKKK